jgi:hypothetical protein
MSHLEVRTVAELRTTPRKPPAVLASVTVEEAAHYQAVAELAVRLPASFRKLAKEEPLLWKLAVMAKSIGESPRSYGEHYCANRDWYRDLKPALCRLVGWDRAGDPVLGTPAAYDLAYKTIYHLLPDCRHEEVWCG